jgi:hypothetical protein
MVHLIPSRMNGISGPIILTQYLILQLLDVRHVNHPLVPQRRFIVLRETRQFLFLDVALYLLDLLIFQLDILNLSN